MLETWRNAIAFYGTFLHLSNNGEEDRNLLITPPCGELRRTIYWDALLQHSLSKYPCYAFSKHTCGGNNAISFH